MSERSDLTGVLGGLNEPTHVKALDLCGTQKTLWVTVIIAITIFVYR